MSPKVYLPNQTRILSINLRKDVYLGAIEKVDKMVRVRDKFLLTTYPKIVSVADGPLVGSVLNNVDDIFNFLF